MIVSSTMPPSGFNKAERLELKGLSVAGEEGVMDAKKLAAPGPVSSC
jgi:hypothetical protein